MVKLANTFETIAEANMRLQNTLIKYENEVYYVLLCSDHKKDGIFRIYLDKADPSKGGLAVNTIPSIPYGGPPSVAGPAMDTWLDANPDKGIIRKMMNSPHFNNFRPFELGMVNYNDQVVYTERRPVRHTQQGLLDSMIKSYGIILTANGTKGYPISILNRQLWDTILGDYPSPETCLENLLNPEVVTKSVGFHRYFAFIKGPINTIFLVYKDSVIGFLPRSDFSEVRIGSDFAYTKEVVTNLNLFYAVNVME